MAKKKNAPKPISFDEIIASLNNLTVAQLEQVHGVSSNLLRAKCPKKQKAGLIAYAPNTPRFPTR